MTLNKLNDFAQKVVNKIMSSDAVDLEEDIPPDHEPNCTRIPISKVYLAYDYMKLASTKDKVFIITNEEFNKAEVEENTIFVSNFSLKLNTLQQAEININN